MNLQSKYQYRSRTFNQQKFIPESEQNLRNKIEPHENLQGTLQNLINFLIFLMFEWKNLELSPEDYQNYINNQDQAQMKINNYNITESQWSQMYRQIQLKSLENKKIKKFVLSYESYMKNLLVKVEGNLGAKELYAFYFKLSNQLKMHFTQIYGQIGLMHIRNLSTTVQFSISRLLNIEEQLIKVIGNLKNVIDELKLENDKLLLQRSSHLCSSCFEQMQKNRNKFYNRQIFAVQQPSVQLEKDELIQMSQIEKTQKKQKEQTKKQQHQYEMDRFYYLNSVEEILRNREKILKCNSAPLQNLLSQYLNQILSMLQGSKFSFTQRNLRQYDRVNKSYESLDDMKSLINTGEFYNKVSLLLQKPYQNLVDNIEKQINKSGKINTAKKITVQTQTLYMQQYDQIKNLQKRIVEFNYQIQNLRQSKSKNEIDLINNIEALRKIQNKYAETYNRNKLLQMQNKKLQKDINEFRKELLRLQEDYKANQNKLIDNNVIQKSSLIKEIKILQAKVNLLEGCRRLVKVDQKQIQTDILQINEGVNDQLPQHKTQREHKKLMIEKRNEKKDYKRVSIKPEDIKIIKQLSLNKNHQQRLGIMPSSSHLKSRNQLSPYLEIPKIQRSQTQKKSIKIYTLSPLDTVNDCVIHRTSSRRISKNDQNVIPQLLSFRTPESTPISNSNRIKKVSGIKRKHAYHNSQIYKKPSAIQTAQKQHRISLIKGKKLKRQNSMEQHITKANIHNLMNELEQRYKINHLNPNNSILAEIKERQLRSGRDQQYISYDGQNEKNIVIDEVINEVSFLLGRLNSQIKNQVYRLIKFSINNYNMLIEKNILGMLYDMTAKGQRVSRKINQVNQVNVIIQKKQEKQQIIDIQCCKIGKKCLQIFFNIEEAEKYQKKIGIWEDFDSFIMVDNNFTSFCEKIAQFFNVMKNKRPMLYQESILFLQKPYYFCQEVEGQQYETKQITMFKESLKLFEKEKDWIKILFKKLLRLHKLMHKNCRHIEKFLQVLGFK